MPILGKKNHLFRWSSFWSWRLCKQAKLLHLGDRKAASIHWKADAPITSHCLVRILVQRHCNMNSCHKVVWSIRNTTLKLCAPISKSNSSETHIIGIMVSAFFHLDYLMWSPQLQLQFSSRRTYQYRVQLMRGPTINKKNHQKSRISTGREIPFLSTYQSTYIEIHIHLHGDNLRCNRDCTNLNGEKQKFPLMVVRIWKIRFN